MKTVGIIGGLGPETTAKFYLELIDLCFKNYKETRPPILTWSIPQPYIIEEDLITKSEGEEKYLPFLIDAAKRLEAGGADFIVIPCNSVHIFIEQIRDAVEIPVLNIVEETIKFLDKFKISEVGLLATSTTIKHNLYQKSLEEKGIRIFLPEQKDQNKLDKIINKLVLNKITNKEIAYLLNLVKQLSNDVDRTILLACTDLQLIVQQINNAKVFDTMKILAEATTREILG
ncbi:MAG: amino acid racemase [Patescibacteria group bacterium]